MAKKLILTFIFIFVSFIVADKTNALCVRNAYETKYEDNEIVFIGKTTNIDEKEIEDPFQTAEQTVNFQIKRIYQGNIQNNLIVSSKIGASDDSPFENNTLYIVRAQYDGNKYTTSLGCGPSLTLVSYREKQLNRRALSKGDISIFEYLYYSFTPISKGHFIPRIYTAIIALLLILLGLSQLLPEKYRFAKLNKKMKIWLIVILFFFLLSVFFDLNSVLMSIFIKET